MFKTIVLDSSAIIALALVSALGFVISRAQRVLCPAGVQRELLESPQSAQYPATATIRRLVASNGIEVKETKRRLAIRGVSKVDAEVIGLAEESHADMLISDDVRLLEKAVARGIRAVSARDFLLQCHTEGRITRATYEAYVRGLHKNGRITETVRDEFLKKAVKA